MAGRARDILVRFLGDEKDLLSAGQRVRGDLDKTAASTKKTAGGFGGMATAIKAISFAALAKGLDILKQLSEAAAEDAKSQKTLADSIRQNTDASNAQISANERWITSMQLSANVADTDLRQAMQSLVTTGASVEDSQRIIAVSLDVAARRGKDFTSVIEAMIKAQNGQVTGLSRLGVATKDVSGESLTFDQILQRLAQTMGGAAAEGAATLAGGLERAKIIMEEAAEEAGARSLPAWSKFIDQWAIIKSVLFGGNKELAVMNERFNNLVRQGVIPFNDKVGSAIKVLRSMLEETSVSKDTFEKLRAILSFTTDDLTDLRRELVENGIELGFTTEQVNAFLLALDIGRVEDYHNALDAARHRTSDLGAATDETGESLEELPDQITPAEAAFDRLATKASLAGAAVRGVGTAQKELLSPAFALLQANQRNEAAQKRLTEAEEAYNEAVKSHGRTSEEVQTAAEDLEDANINAATSYLDFKIASQQLSDTLDSTVLKSLEDILRAAGLAEGAIRSLLNIAIRGGGPVIEIRDPNRARQGPAIDTQDPSFERPIRNVTRELEVREQLAARPNPTFNNTFYVTVPPGGLGPERASREIAKDLQRQAAEVV